MMVWRGYAPASDGATARPRRVRRLDGGVTEH